MTDPFAGGYMHLVPFFVPESLNATAIAASVTPWKSPGVFALSGRLADDPSSPVVGIAYESPVPWLRTADPIPKSELEFIHVARFRLDAMVAADGHVFGNLRKGDDPPDVIVETADGDRGIECTRFTLQARLAAHGLFRELRQRVMLRPGEAFGRLIGQVVQVWFNDEDSLLSLPPRKSDVEAVEELVIALTEYQPDDQAMWTQSTTEGLPQEAPQLPLHKTSAGASFYAVPMQGAVPDSPLYLWAGFELGLAYTTTHPISEEWTRLLAHIDRKDKDGSDWLLVSAGAPDRLGMTFPAEESVLREMLKYPPEFPSLSNLSWVVVHFWSTGEVFELWPNFGRLSGPIYDGIVQTHRTIARPVGESAGRD